MSTIHVKPTTGASHILVASVHYHLHDRNVGRLCDHCGSRWTVAVDTNQNFHVWRNGVSEDPAILDWTGNNVAVECC